MMFVGFLGCYGAIQESQCLLGTVRDAALEATWHPDFPAGWHVAVLPFLRPFPASRAGRMCEHGGGN